jgi:hypothetical protein
MNYYGDEGDMRWVLHVASMGEMKNAEIQNFHRKI